jgi:uncharacterized membrane protein
MFLQFIIAFLVSMVPLIELRGAVPIAVAMNSGLPEWAILIAAIIGNMVPVPFIYLYARKFLEWGSKQKWAKFKKFCNFCLKKGEKAGKEIVKKAGKNGTFVALMLFVAIPLPGTGAWTGALGASILKFDFKKAVISISLGVAIAGLIMLLASLGLFRWIFGA